ncbi:MAG TPA: shikimate kinase [Nitrososphaeraceae archaeon]|nr:shikimate kinase [Nitrososphaeraceae archaeon]
MKDSDHKPEEQSNSIKCHSKVSATVHGAISVVNAIATGYGSALGISLKVTAQIGLSNEGRGIKGLSKIKQRDRLFISKIIQTSIPEQVIREQAITVEIQSEIPMGVGLKSSSAVSNAVSLACHKLIMEEDLDDNVVLDSGIQASKDSKVTITGAYDDSTASYFGGLVLTDNYRKRLITHETAPEDLFAIILIPKYPARGMVSNLGLMSDLFLDAFKLAETGKYWKAMKLNGVLVSAALSYGYEPVKAALQKGAISASISGNGPAVAAVVSENQIENVKSGLGESSPDSRIIISKINNQKAQTENIT